MRIVAADRYPQEVEKLETLMDWNRLFLATKFCIGVIDVDVHLSMAMIVIVKDPLRPMVYLAAIYSFI